VDLWIVAVNDAPVVSDLRFVVSRNTPVSGQLVATDVEGDQLFYWVVSEPKYGTVTVDPFSGAFTYVPNPDSPGTDRFTYSAYDWQTDGNVATVEIIANTSASVGGATHTVPGAPEANEAADGVGLVGSSEVRISFSPDDGAP
jgi:hypothetical protein